MTIACLGWGSLVWRSGNLPCENEWRGDGPALPVEFARQSEDGRVTLVIVESVPAIPVLWSLLDVSDLDAGVRALADRENVKSLTLIGRWPAPAGSSYPCMETISEWAVGKGLAGVVWTALKPGAPGKRGVIPTLDQLVDHLRTLVGQVRVDAVEYVLKTPKQITTPFRAALETELSLRE